MEKQKKVPVRMCISCRGRGEKFGLIRIVKQKDSKIYIDSSGKMNGRGAYICKNEDCIIKAQKERRLNRAFRCDVDSAIYDELISILDGGDCNDK